MIFGLEKTEEFMTHFTLALDFFSTAGLGGCFPNFYRWISCSAICRAPSGKEKFSSSEHHYFQKILGVRGAQTPEKILQEK